MADITPFNFGAHAVRVITRNNQPWFVANDVCQALGYTNPRKAVADHLDDDEKGVTSSDTLGGKQQLTIISESGLYALILRSRKPEARKFAKWVTSEVLPTIRKTGSYQSNTQSQRTALAHQLASQATAQVFDTVFRAVMDGSFNPSLDRLLLSFTPGGPNGEHTPQATTLPHNAIVTTVPHFIRAVASDLAITTPDLTSLALACTQRLASRTCRPQGVFS
ncbi:BRO-N domain-containing protein [Comamonas kerstersii]|uniref:BRO-N domain-containing protein n=1 Tax=Comamonas kerstersii TaxID=225992 RepID=UPI0026DC72FC|nr:Bro-N domain-containing protein [Comamonas kerstersii]